MAAAERLEENLVLREEPGQAWHTGNRQRADEERPVGNRQVLLQPAHVPDVLLAVQRMNHRAAAKEEQRLEEGVCVEMEDTGAEGAHAHRQEHVAELRDGRIREDALDVVLHQTDGAGKQCRHGADHGDHRQGLRRMAEEHGVAPDHVDTRRHHRRGVDESGHGRRPFHRVRQPGVERNLRRLAGGADEEQQRRQRDEAEAGGLDRLACRESRQVLEVEGAESREQQQHPEDEGVVADPVDDEGLLRGVAG